ncbi:MAG TPA: GNAT family N-acetyltransferase [Flavobacterium sp.]|nr:GNAT family N-acetyltransferase [Flavobacterium sp.]
MLHFVIKSFDELSTAELYEILRLRSEVFVVEQTCIYQDIDNKDQKAIHVLGYFDGELAAYSRIFNKHDYFENTSIGRVIVAEKFRDKKFGHELIRASKQAIKDYFDETTIEISAQKHLSNFYGSHGFQPISEMYLEDGIPHIRMLASL